MKSAQHLSASMIKARGCDIHAGSGWQVLKAFRHHGRKNIKSVAWLVAGAVLCSTPFGINDQGTQMIPGIQSYHLKCSTPFGINDQGTWGKLEFNKHLHASNSRCIANGMVFINTHLSKSNPKGNTLKKQNENIQPTVRRFEEHNLK